MYSLLLPDSLSRIIRKYSKNYIYTSYDSLIALQLLWPRRNPEVSVVEKARVDVSATHIVYMIQATRKGSRGFAIKIRIRKFKKKRCNSTRMQSFLALFCPL